MAELAEKMGNVQMVDKQPDDDEWEDEEEEQVQSAGTKPEKRNQNQGRRRKMYNGNNDTYTSTAMKSSTLLTVVYLVHILQCMAMAWFKF